MTFNADEYGPPTARRPACVPGAVRHWMRPAEFVPVPTDPVRTVVCQRCGCLRFWEAAPAGEWKILWRVRLSLDVPPAGGRTAP